MQIVREKASKLVVYLFGDEDELTLGEALLAPDFRALDINADTHEVVTGPAPLRFIGGCLAYDDEWTVVDRELYDTAFPVPISVPRSAARITLFRNDLLGAVEAAVAAAGGETQIWYQDAANWYRNDPNIAALAGVLGLTSHQIDDLFRYAAAGIGEPT